MIIIAIIGAFAFLPSLALNVALALGAPLGLYAMNGRYKVIPKELRKAFVMPIVMQFVALTSLLLGGGILPLFIPPIIATILCFFFAVYLTFYTATVLFSTSHKEKVFMGIFAIIATICFWGVAFSTLNWN